MFEREQDYYADLRQARFGITVKRAGWDCLRHYELAANGCVPCFRELGRKPPRARPTGSTRATASPTATTTSSWRRLERIDDPSEYRRLQLGALRWAAENTTERRARLFLEACGAARGRRRARATELQG